jgi:hypothetical protein
MGWAMNNQIETIMALADEYAYASTEAQERSNRDALHQALEAALKPGVLVGSINKAHLKQTGEPWCKEVLLYSPNNDADFPDSRVTVYTAAPPAQPDALKAGGKPTLWARYPRYTGKHQAVEVTLKKPEGNDWVAFCEVDMPPAQTPVVNQQMTTQTPVPPRLTPAEMDRAYRSAGGGVQGCRAIESAVRKQAGWE